MTTEVINGIEVTDYRDAPSSTLSADTLRNELNTLMTMKEEIERELGDHNAVLRANKNVGMTEALVDEEQFPRADIDLVAVRGARQKIICLSNDMKGVMSKIEAALGGLHSLGAQGVAVARPTGPVSTVSERVPFLRVSNVLPGSPAEQSGLRDGDLVCQMGSLHKDSFSGLGDVAEIVKLSVNKAVPVKVLRGEEKRTLALKPRSWAGKGVLGCNVVDL